MSHNIVDLRDRLFAALDGLADKKEPMEVDRAKAIADVARVIVDSAKAEIHLLQASGAKFTGSEFVPLSLADPVGEQRRLTAGGCSFCGGRMKPETNGNGSLVDRCVSCGRSPAPTPKGEKLGPRKVAEG
jgi:hypothetical protein